MLSEHLLPDAAKAILFEPLDRLVLQRDMVFRVPVTAADFTRFSWCSWPRDAWYWTTESTIARVLVVRMFWLQHFVAAGPECIRYWSYLAMDQHVPMILWCDKHQRAPSYVECVRDGLLPRRVEPLCEETLCAAQYGLQDLLQQDSTNDFFKVIIKSLPRRCICRDVEDRALLQMQEQPDGQVARIFRWMRLGNTHHAQWRPCLMDRVRLHRETPADALRLARATERSLAHALSEFVAVTILNCHAYCSVMRSMMRFDDFWQNTRQLCDRVFRPSLCEAMHGKTPDTAKMERIWNKKKRPSPYRKDAATPLETFLKLLTTASNAHRRPVRPTLLAAALAVNFPDHMEHAVRVLPGCSEEMVDLLHEIVHCVVPRKAMLRMIRERVSPDDIFGLATVLQAYVRPNTARLLPLPLHFYRTQQTPTKQFRICPLCSAIDFNVVGWKRSPGQFESCPRRDWISVCTQCAPEGIPTVLLEMRGRMLLLQKHTCLLCCRCNQLADCTSGAFSRGDAPFLCQKCAAKTRA